MTQNNPTFFQTFGALLFWSILTYCALFFIPEQFKWRYTFTFIQDYAPMIKWTLVLLPFFLWGINSFLSKKKNK